MSGTNLISVGDGYFPAGGPKQILDHYGRGLKISGVPWGLDRGRRLDKRLDLTQTFRFGLFGCLNRNPTNEKPTRLVMDLFREGEDGVPVQGKRISSGSSLPYGVFKGVRIQGPVRPTEFLKTGFKVRVRS